MPFRLSSFSLTLGLVFVIALLGCPVFLGALYYSVLRWFFSFAVFCFFALFYVGGGHFRAG